MAHGLAVRVKQLIESSATSWSALSDTNQSHQLFFFLGSRLLLSSMLNLCIDQQLGRRAHPPTSGGGGEKRRRMMPHSDRSCWVGVHHMKDAALPPPPPPRRQWAEEETSSAYDQHVCPDFVWHPIGRFMDDFLRLICVPRSAIVCIFP